MKYDIYMTEQLRLTTLRVLLESTEYTSNDQTLMAILPGLGYMVGQDKLRSDLRFLEELGLVKIRDIEGTVWIITLTTRGGDVAQGRARAEGVARPRPGP